jgi:hypothetical protein
MKYQDNMTPAELTQFRKELDELDAAYAAAAEHDAAVQAAPEGWEDEMELLTKAALNRGMP